ncbi:hypothetical protein H5410_000226 [Solanum commersonii]|uniref:Uncharacterized protein n=1 Tax=Solanum commersonii TaxID=4109 RepID=A0A9J6AVA8_SOLCO|nr:hypothetical protein H5410_000226 [Solanum commersonii]
MSFMVWIEQLIQDSLNYWKSKRHFVQNDISSAAEFHAAVIGVLATGAGILATHSAVIDVCVSGGGFIYSPLDRKITDFEFSMIPDGRNIAKNGFCGSDLYSSNAGLFHIKNLGANRLNTPASAQKKLTTISSILEECGLPECSRYTIQTFPPWKFIDMVGRVE